MILFENDLIHAYPGSTLTYEVLAINATGLITTVQTRPHSVGAVPGRTLPE